MQFVTNIFLQNLLAKITDKSEMSCGPTSDAELVSKKVKFQGLSATNIIFVQNTDIVRFNV